MDLQELNKLLQTQLAHLLVSIPEPKDLVLDADLTKPLDRVAGIAFLKKHGVEKIYKLESGQKSLPGCSKRVYLVRPQMVTMKYIADQINTEVGKGEQRSYKVVMVPRKLHSCEAILESEGVMEYVTIEEFPLDLIPLDVDLLSLELPDFFKSFYLDKDSTWLHTISSSLVNLQRLFGRIPNVFCIGHGSQMVYDLMQAMFETKRERNDSKYAIGQLFLVDRDMDYITPMCSPMTYEALLDEAFGINCCMIDFDSDVTGDTNGAKLLLTSQDEIYTQIRDRHFAHVFSFLSDKAKELKVLYDKKENLKTVGDMKQFVANELRVLKHQQKLLETHIGACEVIMKTKKKTDFEDLLATEHNLLEMVETKENVAFIEECIHKQFEPTWTLRLLCLLSLTQEGLNQRDYKTLKTQFLHSHGFEHLVTLFHLKKLGILTEQESQPGGVPAGSIRYRGLVRKLNLVPREADTINLKDPKDMSYVFSGAYCPLICKLVEQILTGSLQRQTDVMRLLADKLKLEASIDFHIPPASQGLGSRETNPSLKVILVYFLGGCTYSEISALRLMAKSYGVRVIVATTAMTTGEKLLNSVMDKVSR